MQRFDEPRRVSEVQQHLEEALITMRRLGIKDNPVWRKRMRTEVRRKLVTFDLSPVQWLALSMIAEEMAETQQ